MPGTPREPPRPRGEGRPWPAAEQGRGRSDDRGESNPQNEWVREQNELWRELAGSTITGWSGLDWNVGVEDEDAERSFLDETDPFRQLCALRIHRDGGSPIGFGSYQNGHAFGLSLFVSDGSDMAGDQWSRESNLRDLPVGPVERLEVHLDDRPRSELDVIEALITIGGRSVLVVAAEVYAEFSAEQSPAYRWADESLFVFADPANADQIPWAGERQFVAREISAGEGDALGGTVSPT